MKYIKYIVYAVLVVGAFGLGWYLHQNHEVVMGVSSIGTTNSTQRIAQIVANGNGAYDSVDNQYVLASIANTDANDRVVESISYFYQAITTVSTSSITTTTGYVVSAATSTTANTLGGNTNYLLNTSVATTTPTVFVASTSPGTTVGTVLNRTWLAGSNLNIVANGTTSSPVI